MTVGSLFAGIGGFDLGFERAGFEIKWQVEIDPFCRAVLAKHWPDVRRYEDVRTVGGELAAVDVLCGGFPCQPHSLAGRRGGSDDERDLWPHYARLVRELKPRWVVAENVPGLLSSDAGRFFGTVLGDLAESGYDAEWDCLPASAFGAPHRRDRVWIVAHANRAGLARPSAALSAQPARFEREEWRAITAATRDDIEALAAGCPGVGEPLIQRSDDGLPVAMDRLHAIGNAIVPQIAEWIARRIQEAEG